MKTTQEKIEIMQSFVNGKKLEWHSSMFPEWQETENPSWEWSHLDYRIKQVSPLIIPWYAIKPEYKWAAKDADGQFYVYSEKPSLVLSMKWWEDCGVTGSCSWLGEHMMIKDPDNIDWKDSLVERPST